METKEKMQAPSQEVVLPLLRLHPLAVLLTLGGGDEDAVEVTILALEEGPTVSLGLGREGGFRGEGGVLRIVLDGIGGGGGEGTLEVLEKRFAVGEGDGGDADGESVVDVLCA
ncbi:hypothetical protein LR48_Vigan01g209200 [Vigna angularis]|uniref:Uncharacterized protein n=1 Tax=Phaseolus angularis TaxID=3914 RepID=A0A0L9TPY5_PHAAN|nr:uncharacterized protein HKW66_Vig0032390 [Vigna angularis]KOM32536.1 hypothetical protein LR48_Vigan01g209200 [Vigna angularis]